MQLRAVIYCPLVNAIEIPARMGDGMIKSNA